MDAKFEFVGEGPNGSKRWKIEAISVTTTRNKRKYNEQEMMLGARSLSFRPLDRNHDMTKVLSFPANQTEVMDYNADKMVVEGTMLVADPEINELIRTGKINKLSIEQIPTKGESCDANTKVCEQKGVVFTGLALLDYDIMPGDPNTQIRAESISEVPLYEMVDPKHCDIACCENGEFKGRADLKDSQFGYVSDDGKDRKLPIHDAAHARNALARFNQTDLPADKKAGVLSKIKRAAKKFGVQVSDESDEWYIEKDGKLSMDDIENTYNSMNASQRAHIVDPNNMYKSTKNFVQKNFKDMTDEQKKAMIKTYGFRHSYNDVKHLLGKDDQNPPANPLFDDKLLGQEQDLIDDENRLKRAGIKDPMAQSMAAQNPNNKTEKSSLYTESQTNGNMTVTANSKWTKEKRDELIAKIKGSEKIQKEIDSVITAFVGQQNNKAPLSDKLADVIYNASDDEIDVLARVTTDQMPSVIPAGGLADYKASSQEIANAVKEGQVILVKALEEMNNKWIEANKVKTESTGQPSSQVSDPQFQAKQEMVKATYEYYDVKGHPELKDKRDFSYTLNVQEYMTKFGGFQPSGAGAIAPNGLVQKNAKGETVTVTAGDMGQTFAKQVMLLPGGRMRVPVRQYCNFTEIPNGADRANWYTIGSFVFTTVTEGTEPTNVAQTVTKIQALPTLRGAVQRIGYTQVENAPFGLVDAINNAMVLAGLHDEALDLLGAGGSYWGTASNVTNWVNGNSGAKIVTQNDDIASMTLSRTGVIAAKQLIETGGYDVSPGNLVLFLSPKAYQDLMLDTNLNTYYQYARPDITATYVLEQIYGIDLVISTAVNQNTNTTNNTWRNTMAVKGWALGIATAREITIEVQRRNEVQQLIVSGMHRVKSAVIDYAASCGLSSAQ